MDRLAVAEHVAHHVGAMQAREDVLAVADLAVDESHVVHGVGRGDDLEQGETRSCGRTACRCLRPGKG